MIKIKIVVVLVSLMLGVSSTYADGVRKSCAAKGASCTTANLYNYVGYNYIVYRATAGYTSSDGPRYAWGAVDPRSFGLMILSQGNNVIKRSFFQGKIKDKVRSRNQSTPYKIHVTSYTHYGEASASVTAEH